MSEAPGRYSASHHECDGDNGAIASLAEHHALLQECYGLLNEVSRRPGCLKLLQGVRDQLRIFAGYKANRRLMAAQLHRIR